MIEALTAGTAEEIVKKALALIPEDEIDDASTTHIDTELQRLGQGKPLSLLNEWELGMAIEKVTEWKGSRPLPIFRNKQDVLIYAQQCLDEQSSSQPA